MKPLPLPTIPENSTTMPISGLMIQSTMDETVKVSKDESSNKLSKLTPEGATSEENNEMEDGEVVIGNLKRRNHDLEKQKEKLKAEWEKLKNELDPSKEEIPPIDPILDPILESRQESRQDTAVEEFIDAREETTETHQTTPERQTDTIEIIPDRSGEAKINDLDVEIEAVLKQFKTVLNDGTPSSEDLPKFHDARSDVETSRKELHEAKKRVMEMEYLLSVHRSDLASAKGQVGVLQAENGELRGSNTQFKEALEHYAEKQERTVDCLKGQLAEAESREAVLRKEVEAAKEETKQAKSNYQKADHRAREMGNLVELHQKDYLGATKRIATLEAQNAELREVNRVQGEMNLLLSQMRDAMQGKVDEQQKALITFENQLKESWAREGSLSADIAMANAEAASAKKDLETVQKRAKERERWLQDARMSSEKANKAFQQANSRIVSLEGELDELQSKMSRLEEVERKYNNQKGEACSFLSFLDPESESSGIAIAPPCLSTFCNFVMNNSDLTLQDATAAGTTSDTTAATDFKIPSSEYSH